MIYQPNASCRFPNSLSQNCSNRGFAPGKEGSTHSHNNGVIFPPLQDSLCAGTHPIKMTVETDGMDGMQIAGGEKTTPTRLSWWRRTALVPWCSLSSAPHSALWGGAGSPRAGGRREEGGSQEGREGGDGDDRRNALCPMCHSSLCGRNVCVCAPVLRVCAHAEQPCARTHAAVFSPDSMRLLRSLISSRFVRPAVSHLTPPSLPPSQASGSDMACLPGTDWLQILPTTCKWVISTEGISRSGY